MSYSHNVWMFSFLILLSSTVGINGDFNGDLDLDLLLDDDDDEDDEVLELELDRDGRNDELDEDLQQFIIIQTHNQYCTLKNDTSCVVMMIDFLT